MIVSICGQSLRSFELSFSSITVVAERVAAREDRYSAVRVDALAPSVHRIGLILPASGDYQQEYEAEAPDARVLCAREFLERRRRQRARHTPAAGRPGPITLARCLKTR